MSNQMTPAQRERLVWLMEECGEVVAACGKALRHGYDSTDPNTGKRYDNKRAVQDEVAHVNAAVALMATTGDIDMAAMAEEAEAKAEYVTRNGYLHHNVFTGRWK